MIIDSSEISVVVQGIIDGEKTKKCIESIRHFLPNSDIVLSTWGGVYGLENIDYDTLCVMDDPGANKIKQLGNIYRQIIGRKSGIQKCNRPYTLIIRSDSEILNLNFVSAFQKELKSDKYSKFKWLKHRVIMCSAGYTANSLFFLNDWFFFGETEDIKDIYNIPIIDENSLSDDDKKLPEYNSPHEYLAIQFCKKHMKLEYNYKEFHNPEYLNIWEKILVENFIMIGFYDNYGISNLKQPYYLNQILNRKRFVHGVKHLMLNYEWEDWFRAYKKLYHDNIRTPKRVKWVIARICIRLYRILKPIHCFK